MQLDAGISKRISIIKYVMIIGIVITHIPPFQPIHDFGFTTIETIKVFFAHGVFKVAVPVLATISGFLLFSSKMHLNYPKLIYKKSRSILLPLIIWNLPFAIIIYLIQVYDLSIYQYWIELHPATIDKWLLVVIGWTGLPVNYPLHFLRDLFVVALMTPFFWLLLKRIPYLGFLIVLTVYYFDLEGGLVMRNNMLVTFYLGALAATQKWDLKYLDRYSLPLLLIFICACVVITTYRIDNRELFVILSPFLVWPFFSYIINTKVGDLLHLYSKNSFFLFLSHAPILFILYKVYEHLPINIPYAAFWCIAPAVTILVANPLVKKTREWLPNTAQIALGGR